MSLPQPLDLFDTWKELWPNAHDAAGQAEILKALHKHIMIENQYGGRDWKLVSDNLSAAPFDVWRDVWLPMAQSQGSDVQVLAQDVAVRRLQRLGLEGNDNELTNTLKVLLEAPKALSGIVDVLAAQDGRWQRSGAEVALLRRIVPEWAVLADSEDIHQCLGRVKVTLTDSVAGILLPALLSRAAADDKKTAVGQAVFHGQAWVKNWLTEQDLGAIKPDDALAWARKAASGRHLEMLEAVLRHVPEGTMPGLIIQTIDGHGHEAAQLMLEKSDPSHDVNALVMAALIESGYLHEYDMDIVLRYCNVTAQTSGRLAQAWIRCGHLHGGNGNAELMQRHLVDACPMALGLALKNELERDGLIKLPMVQCNFAALFNQLPTDAKTAALPTTLAIDPLVFPGIAAWAQRLRITDEVDGEQSAPKKPNKM